MADYEFTNTWFDQTARHHWEQLLPRINPSRVLEIGSFEGRSTCYLIETLSRDKDVEIYSVDPFEGAESKEEMCAVEARFRKNTSAAVSEAKNKVDFHFYKGYSDVAMYEMLARGMHGYFDFIYVDGSHTAADVLLDAVLAFKLVRVGGFIGFDDYAWREPGPRYDVLRCPKIAIDAFANIYSGKTRMLFSQISQIYLEKTSD